jgi:hypothetical protein
MRVANLWIVLSLAGAVGACSSGGKSGTAVGAGHAAPAATGAAATVGPASAEEVAAQGRGDVDCPAPASTSPIDAHAPVDDVLGVRPGMSYEEATRVVLCSHPLLVATPVVNRGFEIQTYGQTVHQGFTARFAEARVEKTSRQIMQEMQDEAMGRGMNRVVRDMHPGQSKWFVGTMGMPGQERVINAAREEWFAEGHNPTIDSVVQALIGKYGAPAKRQDQAAIRQLTWIYDPRGRPVTETSPLFNQCQGSADPDGPLNVSANCGVIVSAMVHGLASNPDLGEYLQVGVVDQAGSYAALDATTQGLQAVENQRRAKQLQNASKNAPAPQL